MSEVRLGAVRTLVGVREIWRTSMGWSLKVRVLPTEGGCTEDDARNLLAQGYELVIALYGSFPRETLPSVIDEAIEKDTSFMHILEPHLVTLFKSKVPSARETS